jgi:hypothetical protein
MGFSKEKFHFTIEERILIYLLDFIKYKDQIEVVSDVTQEKISKEVNIERKHAPRSLKMLIEKDLIIEKMKHVTGKTQRMKTYFLTELGIQKARNLKNHFKELPIKFIISNGNVKRISIGEIHKNIDFSCSFARIISYISLDGVFDTNNIKNQSKKLKKLKTKDNLLIYKKALEQAWKDGKMTMDEKQIINSLRKSLNISEYNHLKIEEEILNNLENSSDIEQKSKYKEILGKVIDENNITRDEKLLLKKILKRFDLNIKN